MKCIRLFILLMVSLVSWLGASPFPIPAAASTHGVDRFQARLASNPRPWSPMVYAANSLGRLRPSMRASSAAESGRVEQLQGQSGYAFDIPNTGPVTLATTVTVPTLNCDAVPVRLHNTTLGIQENVEMNGDYAMLQDFCGMGDHQEYQQYDEVNFGDPYFLSGGYFGVMPGMQVSLSESRTASGISATITD